MKELENLIYQLNQLYDRGDLPPKVYKGVFKKSFDEAYEAAQELWEYAFCEDEIIDDQLREAYINALFKVADYFKYAFRRKYLTSLNADSIFPSRISYLAIAPLKRAYSLDAGHIVASADFSYKELAAYKLGFLYKEARCHNSAVWWFRRSLSLARAAGVKANVLGGLHQLAWNLETLAHYKESGQYYDEMMEMLSAVPRFQHPLDWVEHAAMYHIHHGDQARGEAIMRELIAANLGNPISPDSRGPLPEYFYTALNSLGMHYIATGRFQEAIKLARMIIENVHRFDEPEWVRDATHGLIARALVHMGQLDGALKELSQVYDVKTTTFITYQAIGQNLGLWIDIARIHVANHHYELAITAYEILAYHLGALIANRDRADTTRLRFYWLQQMAFVVHEMASVWLTITEMQTRQAVEATVANALLQLKANLFIAIEAHKDLRFSPGHELFMANRSYAVAARKVADKPADVAALLELEDALFIREDIERSSLEQEPDFVRFAPEISQTLFDDNPGMRSFLETHLKSNSILSERSMFLRFDFRQSQELGDDTLLLDYSLVNYQPPCNGLAGPSQGLRYIGVRLSKGSLRMIDLGQAEQIVTLCQPLIEGMSRQPVGADDDTSGRPQKRQLRPADWDQRKNVINLDQLAESVYGRIVAPFEPLSRSLLFSPSGILAALPFHALLHENRYLIEDRDIAYCHSLLQKESLSMRLLSGSVRASPPSSSALLLGDPDYTMTNLSPLRGTKLEVTRVAELLRTKKVNRGKKDVVGPLVYAGRSFGFITSGKGGGNVFEEVQVYTGADATVSRLLGVDRPLILHIAAHGTFDEDKTQLFAAQPFTSGGYYRQVEEMGASPFTQLDNALLHSTVILAEDSEAVGDPTNGTVLTALELASLNLLSCNVVVLSACETGAGVTEYGAGVLGFQYALHASFARAGLLSLWKVLDQETSAFMIDFYRKALDQRSIKKGYLSTVRKHCRRNGQRVHPYYWAAIMLLDQEYVDPY